MCVWQGDAKKRRRRGNNYKKKEDHLQGMVLFLPSEDWPDYYRSFTISVQCDRKRMKGSHTAHTNMRTQKRHLACICCLLYIVWTLPHLKLLPSSRMWWCDTSSLNNTHFLWVWQTALRFHSPPARQTKVHTHTHMHSRVCTQKHTHTPAQQHHHLLMWHITRVTYCA